jgi:hypothetical protein
VDDGYQREHHRPHPLFEAPAAALHVLATFLDHSRQQACALRDVEALERLEMVEDALVERVHALAAVHPEDAIRQLGVELVPR